MIIWRLQGKVMMDGLDAFLCRYGGEESHTANLKICKAITGRRVNYGSAIKYLLLGSNGVCYELFGFSGAKGEVIRLRIVFCRR